MRFSQVIFSITFHVLCCCPLPEKLIILFNNASRSQCIIDGEVLNRRWEQGFQPFSCSFWKGGWRKEGHKSCLLTRSRLNTTQYYHALKPCPLDPNGAWSFYTNKENQIYIYNILHKWPKSITISHCALNKQISNPSCLFDHASAA